jgi:hypothetical protein
MLIAQLAKPGASIWTKAVVGFATPYWSFSIALNILLTILIVARMLWARKTILKAMGKEHGKGYAMVAAMMIESAGLYTIFGVLYLVCYGTGNPVQEVWLNLLGESQVSILHSSSLKTHCAIRRASAPS